MPEPLTGIVLAGGGSRRLGQDKAALTFGGRTLLEMTIEKLAANCDEILLSGRNASQALEPHSVRYVADAFPGQGPLAGIEAGLSACEHDFALAVACDMPFLNAELLAYMASQARDYEALVPLYEERPHPLHAIYSRSCLPNIRSLLKAGRNAMMELLSEIAVTSVPEDVIQELDPEGLSLFNLNQPEDLVRARELWQEQEAGSLARKGGDHEP